MLLAHARARTPESSIYALIYVCLEESFQVLRL